MPQRDAERARESETHTEWRERGEKVSLCWQRVREGRRKSEGDANAEREADKKLVMECERRGGGEGETKGGEISKGGWKGE